MLRKTSAFVAACVLIIVLAPLNECCAYNMSISYCGYLQTHIDQHVSELKGTFQKFDWKASGPIVKDTSYQRLTPEEEDRILESLLRGGISGDTSSLPPGTDHNNVVIIKDIKSSSPYSEWKVLRARRDKTQTGEDCFGHKIEASHFDNPTDAEIKEIFDKIKSPRPSENSYTKPTYINEVKNPFTNRYSKPVDSYSKPASSYSKPASSYSKPIK